MTPSSPDTTACPRCAATIAFDRRFGPWCATCDWNVLPPETTTPPTSRLQRRRLALVRRVAGVSGGFGARDAVRPPRFSPATVALWLGSVAVFVVWLVLVAAGVALVVVGPILVKVIGLVVLLVAVISRPRLGSPPDHPLSREEAPQLYGLLDEIADRMQAPRVSVVGVIGDWNAGTYRYGLRQRTAILIGLPLWYALDDPGRIGILGHEVAHGANGDTAAGTVQSVAFRTLWTWAAMTEPDPDATGLGESALLMLPTNALLAGISMCFTALASGLELVALRPHLRAELYADRLAASLVGTPAMVSALEHTWLAGTYTAAVTSAAVAGRSTDTLLEEIAKRVASTPPSEIARLRRREYLAPTDVDPTHPPTTVRIELLKTTPLASPTLAVSSGRMRAIDAEFEPHAARVSEALVDEYLDAIS